MLGGVHALHKLGHQEIGLVNGPSSSMKSRKCLEGYKQALSELGISYKPDYFFEISEFDAVITADTMLPHLNKKQKLTGVVCAADYLAMGVIKAAGLKGISVPRDLSVIGFGDVPFAEFFIPSLSTVHVDLIGIGREAATVLTDSIKGKKIRKMERVFEMEYINRDTSSIPSVIK